MMDILEKPSLDELAHYGVLGMKWGVRKSDSSVAGDKKLRKADKKWEKKAGSAKSFYKVYNAAARRMNKEIDRINSKPQYRNKDFTYDSPLRKKYYKEYEDVFNRFLNEESERLIGSSSPSGNRRIRYNVDAANDNISYRFEDVKHADSDPYFVGVTDDRGYIVSIRPMNIDEDISQSDIEDAVVHYGVKGMRWGVRRDEPTNSEYSSRMQAIDRSQHGKRAVRRINRRMNKGMSRDEALEREDVRNAYQRLALLGGVFVASVIADHGAVSAHSLKNYVGNRANENRARARNNTLGISSTAAKTPYIKPGRGGVYNITTKR